MNQNRKPTRRIHSNRVADNASSRVTAALRAQTWAPLLGVCGAFALCACSSDAASPGAAGASSMGGAHAMAGAPAVAGSGSSGAPGMAGSAGSSNGGSAGSSAGSSSAGSSSGGASGTAGASGGAGGSGGASGGSGGAAGGSGGGGGSAGSGDCAGHAVSLSGNAASDSAKARVEINLMSDLPVGNSNRTVEFWAYMKTADWQGNVNTLFFYGDNVDRAHAPGFGLDFGNTTGGIGSLDPFTNGVFDNDDQPSGIMVSMNQWVHFAMTWDGTAVLAFVNGVQKASKTGSGSVKTLMTATSVFTLGGYPGENAYFPDYLDELRIWNVARSAADILANKNKALMGNEAGLVGYWKFNESSGTTAADSVTSAGHTAHNGTLMAAMANQVPTFVVPTPPAPITCP